MSRLNHEKKFNNASISNTHKINKKQIRVYKIDAKDREIYPLEIENSLEYILKAFDFYNYDAINFGEREILFLGIDSDYDKNIQPYLIKGQNKNYFCNGVLVKFPATEDNENLQSVKSDISQLLEYVDFTDTFSNNILK